ncbi:MAG TPA: hypothetical protein VHZ55_30155 [Bryobacteraceae bacterium]|jgi:hypothetical protein|nr:hypothetical protein [Bryobacteraceae bacterium]
MKGLLRFATCLYPASWRKRYGVELDALIEDLDHPGWRTFLDIAKGAAEMQVRMKAQKTVAVTAMAGMLIGLGVSLTAPRQYASKVVINIVSGSSDNPPTNKEASDSMNRLVNGVLSQSSLKRIVQAAGLHENEHVRAPLDEALADLKKGISVKPVSATAFAVQFADDNPTIAQRATQQLAASLLDENLRAALRESRYHGRPLTLEIASAPNLPRQPFSPSWWKLSIAGVAAGTFLGMLVARFRRSPMPG